MADEDLEGSPEGAADEGQGEQPANEPAEGEPAEQGDKEGDQPEGDPGAEKPPVELPRKKTAQERIDEITKARREAEREREYWKQEALKRQPERPEPQQPAKPSADPTLPPRPTLEQFDSTTAYEDALFEWRDKVTSIKAESQRRQTEQEEALASFQKKAADLRAEYEDFDEVIESPVYSPTMQGVILRSENGPDIAYFLGRPENRDVADRIRALAPERQAYEIGKLERDILLAKKTKKVPGAPPPIKPVGMGGAGGGEIDESKLSDEEWYALEKKRTLERLKKKHGG